MYNCLIKLLGISIVNETRVKLDDSNGNAVCNSDFSEMSREKLLLFLTEC